MRNISIYDLYSFHLYHHVSFDWAKISSLHNFYTSSLKYQLSNLLLKISFLIPICASQIPSLNLYISTYVLPPLKENVLSLTFLALSALSIFLLFYLHLLASFQQPSSKCYIRSFHLKVPFILGFISNFYWFIKLFLSVGINMSV